MKCNFKKEANTLFGGSAPVCSINNEDCHGEDKCILHRRIKK